MRGRPLAGAFPAADSSAENHLPPLSSNLERPRQRPADPPGPPNVLPEGSFTTTLVQSRVNYTFTPRMFFSGLLQYNSSGNSLNTNLRLRWEYSPGSELFVVYTEDRNTDPFFPDRFTDLRNQGFVVKLTRLFRF